MSSPSLPQLNSIYGDNPTYFGSTVMSLSSGSIRVSYILSFLLTSPITAEQVTNLFNTSLSTLGEIEDSAVFIEPLEEIVHGMFNNLGLVH